MRSLSKILSDSKPRKWIIIHLVFFLALWDFFSANSWDVIKEFRQFYNQHSQSRETDHLRRVQKIKDILPKQGIAGYFTNRDYDRGDYDRHFFLTQYALAPLLITRGTKPEVIIADVNQSFNIIEFSNKYNCRLVKKSDDGILVFRKKTK